MGDPLAAASVHGYILTKDDTRDMSPEQPEPIIRAATNPDIRVLHSLIRVNELGLEDDKFKRDEHAFPFSQHSPNTHRDGLYGYYDSALLAAASANLPSHVALLLEKGA